MINQLQLFFTYFSVSQPLSTFYIWKTFASCQPHSSFIDFFWHESRILKVSCNHKLPAFNRGCSSLITVVDKSARYKKRLPYVAWAMGLSDFTWFDGSVNNHQTRNRRSIFYLQIFPEGHSLYLKICWQFMNVYLWKYSHFFLFLFLKDLRSLVDTPDSQNVMGTLYARNWCTGWRDKKQLPHSSIQS